MGKGRGAIWSSLVAMTMAAAVADDAPPPSPPPQLRMAIPFAAPAGARVKVVVRGWQLAATTAIHVELPDAAPTILAKGAAAIPNGLNASVVGAEQVEFEMTLPAGTTAGPVALRVESPAGTSAPYSFLITAGDTAEAEPNEGFSAAQVLTLPAVVTGSIQGDRDVDVFSFPCPEGRTLVARVDARAHGSALDGLLSLFDGAGTLVASNDDGDTADAELRVPISASGTYRLVLQDAHDRGGPTHPYRLTMTLE